MFTTIGIGIATIFRSVKGDSGGGPPFEYTPIDNSFSMLFDGTSYMNIGSSIDLGINSTISFWHKTSDNNFGLVVFGESTYPYEYLLQWGSTSNNLVYLRIGSVVLDFTGVTELQDGNWHNYCIVRTGADAELFIDGSSRSTVSGFSTSTNTLIDTIGATSSGTSNLNNSYLDEIAFWSSALSEETIQAIYDTTANNPGKVADLSETPEGVPTAWYRMGD